MNVQQIKTDYERDGVVRVRNFFSPQRVGEVRRELQRYIQNVVPDLLPVDRVWEADGASLRNLWRMEQHDSYFRDLGQSPEILTLIGELVHGEPLLAGVETFNKPARTGSAVPPHQDNAYFCQSPPHMLTLWIALDPATVENGAVYYIPGSHHELLPHCPSGVEGNSIGLAQPPELGSVKEFCGTLEPGDALIHNCQVIHRSDPNYSEQSRCGLLMVYRGAHTRTENSLREDYEKARALVAPV